jgi:Fe-S-cluster containining protein
MKKELDEQLVKKYPLIFKNRYGDVKETLMCWGFECGNGWYQILDSLCANIQHHIDWKEKQRQWTITFNSKAALEEMKEVPDAIAQVVAVQVKEKFGGLRFYYDGGDDQISGMVRMAESWAANTCETCGAPGKSRNGGWIKTLCDNHEEERQEHNLLKQGLEG